MLQHTRNHTGNSSKGTAIKCCENIPGSICRNSAKQVRHFAVEESGQAAVEAAFLLPILMILFGLLLQPVILLYDRSVMNSAAMESCRLAATAASKADVESFARRRLGLIPNLSIFHEGGSASWDIKCSNGKTEIYTVTITHEVLVLPLFGITAGLFAQMSDGNSAKQTVTIETPVHAAWYAQDSKSASDWISQWK